MKRLILAIGVLAVFDQATWAKSGQSFDVGDGQTLTSQQTLTDGQTGVVEQGGSVTTGNSKEAITASSGNVVIVNSGTIEQNGTGRAIRDDKGGLTLTVTNNVGALMQTADADVIQMNEADSNVVFYNYGTLISKNASAGGSQAVDFNATSGRNVLYNFSTGVIEANEADAVRPGVNGFVYNDGLIRATNNPGSTSSSDGIDAQGNSGITVVNAPSATADAPVKALIEGARHGITGGNTDTSTDGTFILNVTNNWGGTIEGADGSGINVDGFNANELVTVVNHGSIIGNGLTGDGDGVDVDGLVDIHNTGVIRSTQSFEDVSEGVTVGGGTIVNSGTIEGDNVAGGVGRGITLAGVDKDADGNPIAPLGIYGNTVVVNSGLIRGQSDSAIAVTGARNDFTVEVVNLASGVLEGGGTTAAVLAMGANDATVIDYGSIVADQSGKAVDLGGGNSRLQILGGAAHIQGDLSGGTGTSTLSIAPGAGNRFDYDGAISNFASVEIGSGIVTLNGASPYGGATTVDAGGALVVGGAGHADASIGAGLTSVAAGGVLGGYGTVAGAVDNAGTLYAGNALPRYAGDAAGTLTIGGDYTGHDALLLLKASLNQNGQNAQGDGAGGDRLAIGGNAGGNTLVRVQAANGGAATQGAGIELVQVGGRSAAGAFRLAAPLQAGAYQYLLYRGAGAGGSTADAANWYLRTAYEAPSSDPAAAGVTAAAAKQNTGSAADAAVPAPLAQAAADQGAGGSGGAVGSPAPVAWRPGVAGYSMTPLLNVDYGFDLLGRLDERVGDAASAGAVQPARANGVWGRLGGQNLRGDAAGRFSADERTFFAQFGKDWTLARGRQGGSTHAGVTLAFGSSSASFADSARGLAGLSTTTGSLESQAQSLGGYWTRYLPNGLYIDGEGQLTHYRNRYGDVFGDGASQNGFGAGLSGEVGKPFALGLGGLAIEPQAQLLYQYLHLNHFSDAVSDVSGNATSALRGRLGLRLFEANLGDASKTGYATPYVTADVLHDFLSPGATTVGGAVLDNALSKTWYELGVGVTASFGKSSSLYANVKYGRNLGGDYRRDVFGQAGLRFNW